MKLNTPHKPCFVKNGPLVSSLVVFFIGSSLIFEDHENNGGPASKFVIYQDRWKELQVTY